MAGFLGVITRLRSPLELRFVIHQNPGLICIWLSSVPLRKTWILHALSLSKETLDDTRAQCPFTFAT